LKKEGAGFDLGIALGMIAAGGLLDRAALARTGVIGELALNGQVRPVRGALPIAAMLSEMPEVDRILVPQENVREAALASARAIVYPVSSLAEAVKVLQDGAAPFRADLPEYLASLPVNAPDFSEVKGQVRAKRALEIAAAGGHHLLMIGSPGCGKTMLAMRLPGILPPMSREEMLETSRIHSVLGLLAGQGELMNVRPFRAPHHTASDIGIIGGGRDPRPGEISLAHNGVLFLDELPEFKRNVLEVLRQPLESGTIAVSRAAGSCVFPARFMLCSAMNPCPCGRGEPDLGCTCSVMEKQRYLKRISGPILDRIDLHIELRQLSPEELLKAPDGESSQTIRQRVIAARALQESRLAGTGLVCNAQMTGRHLQKFCRISPAGEKLLRQAVVHFHLSPRAYDRILKVARTIADLAGSECISDQHLLEAVSCRKSGLCS
jgi:magnesium chelatase family protein